MKNIVSAKQDQKSDVMGDHDAVALSELLLKGEISPLELTRAAIERAKAAEPYIHAIQEEAFDLAIIQAKSQQNLICQNSTNLYSIFAGIPFFVKDNTDVLGMKTTQGSHAFTPKIASQHSPLTQLFIDQGFNILGKSTLPEFGLNASTEFVGQPATRNPWNLDYSSGASSGGSAALVASGVVPIAHANDGGGSIRIPAACCGLVGLKPSRGRLMSPPQAAIFPINIISEGVVTRSVRDTAHFYASAEQYYQNKKLPALGLIERPNSKRLRIGILFDSIRSKTDAETRHTLSSTAKLLEGLGHHVTEISMPVASTFTDDFLQYWAMLSFLVSKLGRVAFNKDFDSQKLEPLTFGLMQHFKKNFFHTPKAISRLKQSARDYEKSFDQFDVIMTPVLAHTTPKIGYLGPDVPFDKLLERLLDYVAFTPIQNITGTPAISLPMGVSQVGLPIGVHFCGKYGDERTLIELAYELELAQPWAKSRIPAA
ncbi:amidase [Aquirhabdus parva]|uniref:Amidase n=1 Tax=Aquirhabdus parva TaxID=2283318 RepID=A0A345P5X7_9GAMM|nr:amidase [Aquirhabdus parva]AXI02686.1 amidase [Aquirhabdus parva]